MASVCLAHLEANMASWIVPLVALLAVSTVQPFPAHMPLGKEPLRCSLCLNVMEEVYKLSAANKTVQCMEALVAKGCKMLHIEDSTVCRGAISEYGNILIYVVENLLLDPRRLCGALFPGCGGARPPGPRDQWTVPPLNTTKPPRVKPVLPSPDKPKLRVLHLSDLHFDAYYVEGSEADCGEPLCCRTNASKSNCTEKRVIVCHQAYQVKGAVFIAKQPAGKWGTSSKCDLPLRTIENMFQHLASRDDIDYIIWTGDAPPHNVWDQTKQDQLTVLDTLTDLFSKYFPNRVLISAVGNHESAPANNFPPFSTPNIPSQYSTTWLFQTFADQWTKFGIGTDPDIYKSIQNIASYVTKPYPGLRVMSLNTMYCLEGNFWLYLNEYDPDNMLQWVMRQLQDAENVGDKVHIIGHVPPGDTCLKEWSANFYDILNRYENTITGLFYGHTHQDTFFLVYENVTLTDPIHVGYVAPSATVYENYWPSFRIYTIDGNYKGSSYRVLDHETYMLNLDDANQSDNPKWELEYKAMDAYKLDSLLPAAWNDLIGKFVQDDDLFQKYNRHKSRAPTKSCTRKCKHDALCVMRSGRSHDKETLCQDLPDKYGYDMAVDQFIQIQDLVSVRAHVQREFSILPKSCHL